MEVQNLSEPLEEEEDNEDLQVNLFRDLFRIMPSIGKVEHQRIRSFSIEHHGVVSLSKNATLNMDLHWR